MPKQIRYKRPVPDGMVKKSTKLVTEVATGDLLEFTYGTKQKQGQVGGWKNDPRPVLLVFYDDGKDYIEGLNTNYLSDYYIKKLNNILLKFPGLRTAKKGDRIGEELYKVVKRTANYAVKKGYRKYIRKSLRDSYVYVAKEL